MEAVGLQAVTEYSAYSLGACALEAGGSAWCWGENGAGVHGNGTVASSLVPIQIPNLAAKHIAVDAGHACAVTMEDEVECWGLNAYGELGNGTFEDSLVPVPVPGLTAVRSVVTRDRATCAMLEDESVYCWGAQDAIGVETGQDEPLPVRVPLP